MLYSLLIVIYTGVVMGGCPWIIQDGLGILGVRGYSDTGVGGGWTSMDCQGWSGYARTQLPGHPRNVVCVQDMVAWTS